MLKLIMNYYVLNSFYLSFIGILRFLIIYPILGDEEYKLFILTFTLLPFFSELIFLIYDSGEQSIKQDSNILVKYFFILGFIAMYITYFFLNKLFIFLAINLFVDQLMQIAFKERSKKVNFLVQLIRLISLIFLYCEYFEFLLILAIPMLLIITSSCKHWKITEKFYQHLIRNLKAPLFSKLRDWLIAYFLSFTLNGFNFFLFNIVQKVTNTLTNFHYLAFRNIKMEFTKINKFISYIVKTVFILVLIFLVLSFLLGNYLLYISSIIFLMLIFFENILAQYSVMYSNRPDISIFLSNLLFITLLSLIIACYKFQNNLNVEISDNYAFSLLALLSFFSSLIYYRLYNYKGSIIEKK